MKDGVVVDANIIDGFQDEYLLKSGKIFLTINTIIQSIGLAICDIIEIEWRKRFRHQYMKEWLTDEIKAGRIKYVKPYMNPSAIRLIRIKFGLNDSRDRQYIKCANVTIVKYILTHDIDFFDPTKKKSSQKERNRVMNQRKGALCRYLKKTHNITVGMLEHCCNDLGLMS